MSIHPDELEKTRVASIDPSKLSDSGFMDAPTALIDPDATVMAKRRSPLVSSRTTEEYIPVNYHKPTGEVTTLWDNVHPGLGARRLLTSGLGRRRVMFGSAALLCLLLGAALFWASRCSKVRNPPAVSAVAPVPKQVDTEKTRATYPGKVSQAAAAGAVIEGRLDVALGIYRELLKSSPGNEAYSLAVSILETRVEDEP